MYKNGNLCHNGPEDNSKVVSWCVVRNINVKSDKIIDSTKYTSSYTSNHCKCYINLDWISPDCKLKLGWKSKNDTNKRKHTFSYICTTIKSCIYLSQYDRRFEKKSHCQVENLLQAFHVSSKPSLIYDDSKQHNLYS